MTTLVSGTDLGREAARARAAQGEWARRGVRGRLGPFGELRRILVDEADAVAAAIARENGKTPLEALSQEILPVLDTLHFLGERAAGVLEPRRPRLATKLFYFRGREVEVRREPWGLVGILGTWNYAFVLSLTQALFALAAGNAVVLKGAAESPRVTELIAGLLERAGFPRGLVFAYAGGREAGEALVAAGCDKVVLTGSRGTGRRVLAALGERLIPAVAELSGCDAYVILDDADWETAVRTLVWAAFQYSGQTCAAPRRVFFLERDRARFLGHLDREWERSRAFIEAQGMLRDPERARAEREKITALAARGARRVRGADFGGAEAFFPPQVYEGVRPEDLEDLEFMAPVFFLFPCADEARMREAAGRTSWGLGASVWTRDRARGRRWAQLRAGQVWVNDALFSVALGELPFGGAGGSGYGRTRGPEGLLEMTQAKVVSFNAARGWQAHLPPYGERTFEVLRDVATALYARGAGRRLRALARAVRTAVRDRKPRG
jgi:succinate-semialdehyde dehydrogenase/glutarate-semialdehyde dehydrogenase